METKLTRQEIGLKGIYRFLGNLIAKFLNKIFKPFNPNIITATGFLVYIIGVGFFAVYGEKAKYDIGLIMFIVGTQLALILDFVDGSYARMINRTTNLGDFLDSFLGTLRFIILLGIAYFIGSGPTEKYAVVFLTLIYVLNQRAKVISPSRNVSEATVREKESSTRPNINMNSLMRFPFGFGAAHFYLYITLWFIFDFVYFLFVLYIVGLLSVCGKIRSLLEQNLGSG